MGEISDLMTSIYKDDKKRQNKSKGEYKTIKKAIVKKYDCFFAYFCI